jgi:O-antigen ligase
VLIRFLIAIVALAPLPLGATRPWASMLLGVLVGVLLFAWALKAALDPAGPAIPVSSVWPLLVLFGAVVLWEVLQMSTLTPAAWHHPMWRSAAGLLDKPIAGSISVTPFATGSALVRLLTYGGIFWIALQSCRAAREAHAVFLTLTVAGLLYAAYGLLVQFSGGQTILWFHKERYIGDVTGTFEYKNAYATYAGLGAICAVGLLLKGMEKFAGLDFGKREARRLTVIWLAERGWFLAVAILLTVTGLLLSHSRAGFVCSGVALVALLLCARFIRGPRIPLLRPAAITLVLAFTGFVAISGGKLLDRLSSTDVEADVRPLIYDATMTAVADAPWLGTGAGSFAEVFSLYHPPAIYTRVLRAHDSYLENALELGIPAAIVLILAFAGPAVICLAGIRRRRRDALYPCIGVAASLLVGLHATVDFTLQVPAVAATYALIMGAACSQSWSTRNGET